MHVVGDLPRGGSSVMPNVEGNRNDVPGVWAQDSGACLLLGDTKPYRQAAWLA